MHWVWSPGELRINHVDWYPQCCTLLPKGMWFFGQQHPPPKRDPHHDLNTPWHFLRELSDHLGLDDRLLLSLTKMRNNCSSARASISYSQILPGVPSTIKLFVHVIAGTTCVWEASSSSSKKQFGKNGWGCNGVDSSHGKCWTNHS